MVVPQSPARLPERYSSHSPAESPDGMIGPRMRNPLVAWLVAALAGVAVLGLWHGRDPDRIVLPTPEWLRPVAEPQAPAPADASAESPIADMVPPGKLGAAIADTRQEITFQAAVPLGSELSVEVAEATVHAVEALWAHNREHAAAMSGKPMARFAEFLFWVWPEMDELLRSGVATIEPGQLPPGNGLSYGSALWGHDFKNGIFAVRLFTPRWLIRIRIDTSKDRELSEMFKTLQQKKE